MSGNLYLSAASAEARLQQLDVIADNLANTTTNGFRATEVVFESVLDAALEDGASAGDVARSFVASTQAALRSGTGPIQRTGRDLDVAIQGPGYLVVETDAGVRYTRNGALHVDEEGQLVSADGHLVLGEGGPIDVGGRPVTIESDGAVRNDEGELLGRLRIDEFLDPDALTKEGGSLLRASETAVGVPVEAPRLASGSLESSNVLAVQEMARLIAVQRAFDAALQTLEADDAASGRLLQEI